MNELREELESLNNKFYIEDLLNEFFSSFTLVYFENFLYFSDQINENNFEKILKKIKTD